MLLPNTHLPHKEYTFFPRVDKSKECEWLQKIHLLGGKGGGGAEEGADGRALVIINRNESRYSWYLIWLSLSKFVFGRQLNNNQLEDIPNNTFYGLEKLRYLWEQYK